MADRSFDLQISLRTQAFKELRLLTQTVALVETHRVFAGSTNPFRDDPAGIAVNGTPPTTSIERAAVGEPWPMGGVAGARTSPSGGAKVDTSRSAEM